MKVFALFAVLAIALVAYAKPERTDPDKKASPPHPQIAFVCQFGKVEQVTTNGTHRVTVTGVGSWQADGLLRQRNGKWEVALNWTLHTDTPTHAFGIYAIETDGTLRGHYNYLNQLEDDGSGGVTGLTIGEHLYKVGQ